MRYSHPTPENRRKAVDVLADVFNRKGQRMAKNRVKTESDEEEIHSLSYN
jgi:hypothetical protein